MNLIKGSIGGTPERPTVTFGEHTVGIADGALERYPQVVDRIGGPVIVGLRPEHFAMEGDIDVPDDQLVTVHVELAEAMGAEVHIHTSVDVPPVAVDGAPVTNEDLEALDTTVTPIIARVEGIHEVANDSDVRLAVKSHLIHFFDPDDGEPLR